MAKFRQAMQVFSAALVALSVSFAIPQSAMAQQAPSTPPAAGAEKPLTMDKQAAVLNWTSVALMEAHTFSFATYEKDMARASKNFTEQGWKEYDKALMDSGNFDALVQKQMSVVATPLGQPLITGNKVLDGQPAILIEVPLRLTFSAVGEGVKTKDVVATATVVGRPLNENATGLGIAQIITR